MGDEDLVLRAPVVADGARIWGLVVESGKLDVNSSYLYLLWCRDFAATSVVAEVGGELGGFVIGYRRPAAPDTYFLWQVAVRPSHRGRGLGGRMMDGLLSQQVAEGVRWLEATVTPDNEASQRLFQAFADRWGATLERSVLFAAADFPDAHEPESLLRIGPLEA